VKQLYGTAGRCAGPACPQLLYRVSGETGERVLSSRVAHIRARREGGPRWDPLMTEEENRSAENLLLLCEAHASEIDATSEHYPPELLQEWKQAQLAEYLELGASWLLSDAQAAEVVARSFGLGDLVQAISAVVPFSPRSRSREEALDLAAARSMARREVRLRPMVPRDRLPAVLSWMKDLDDPVVAVPEGGLRVLLGPMGWGKTELASRWWDEGVRMARADADVQIPVWLLAREITAGVEAAVSAAIGGDPVSSCRIVIDDLDGVSPREADQILDEARQLVLVWPNASVLATSRPGVLLGRDEAIRAEPWPAGRGRDLVRLVAGREPPWTVWAPETLELLTSPLLALALAVRLLAGRDEAVSSLQVLSGLARTIIEAEHPGQATPQVWDELARLAVRILGSAGPVTAGSFGNEAQVWQVTATDLVVNDEGALSFALPVFEQHFGAQALGSDAIALETAAAAGTFPRWRYAIAFAIAASEAALAEQSMIRLARANPAAASWVLDEVAPCGAYGTLGQDADDASIRGMISRWQAADVDAGGNIALLAGGWLRQAQQALLEGCGPLAGRLARHRDGQLVRWGARVEDGWVGLAEARDAVPPPEIEQLETFRPGITLASGWIRSELFKFPDADLGRWHWARDHLRPPLMKMIRRRTLPVPPDSRLAQERAWFLGQLVMHGSYRPHHDAVPLEPLREKVREMMGTVNRAVEARWSKGTYTIDSADVRWLDAHLQLIHGEWLERPWPAADQKQRARRWAWEAYSPELTRQMLTGVLRDAVTGYRELVESSFPRFGASLGLYGTMPVQIDGIVTRFEDDQENRHNGLLFAMTRDPAACPAGPARVTLDLLEDPGADRRWQFAQTYGMARQSASNLWPLEEEFLPFHFARPATNFSYEWLARDLKAVGWLSEHIRFHD